MNCVPERCLWHTVHSICCTLYSQNNGTSNCEYIESTSTGFCHVCYYTDVGYPKTRVSLVFCTAVSSIDTVRNLTLSHHWAFYLSCSGRRGVSQSVGVGETFRSRKWGTVAQWNSAQILRPPQGHACTHGFMRISNSAQKGCSPLILGSLVAVGTMSSIATRSPRRKYTGLLGHHSGCARPAANCA
jgi:hypothetical protein